MLTQIATRIELETPAVALQCDPVQAAETILRRFGARAITILTSPRLMDDGRTLPPRLSANDCYVALEEACRKMARVALRKYQSEPDLATVGFAASVDRLFPDAVAYLTRCIRSVVSDAERDARRELPTVSFDQPLSAVKAGDTALCLRDTLAEDSPEQQPEQALLNNADRAGFRKALATALKTIPANYLQALERDMERERQRQAGQKVLPETDRERQTVCRARAALATVLQRETGEDNPYVRLLAQQRSSRVRQKTTPSRGWNNDRQKQLFEKLLRSSWQDRSADAAHPDGNLDEAVLNEVSVAREVASPSPEMRQAMRVMDTYTLADSPTTDCPEAQKLYAQARTARYAGKTEDAIRLYKAAYEQAPKFYAAYNEVGVLLSQLGNLRDALKVYLAILEKPDAGEHRYIAATNASDIYLTWFDSGRNRDKNIEQAIHFAQEAMEKPTPMRACNLLMAYVKDRYYVEARQLMDTVLHSQQAQCTPEKFLQTLFQIRDADLVSWWTWLDGELGKDNVL